MRCDVVSWAVEDVLAAEAAGAYRSGDAGAGGAGGRLVGAARRVVEAATELQQAVATAATAVERGDETSVDDRDWREGLTALGRAESALTAAKASLIAAAETAGAHTRDGAADATAWVADALNTSRGHAKRDTALAARLDTLDDTANALAEGAISRAHAEQIAAGTAGASPEQRHQRQHALLHTATSGGTPEQVRDHAALLRQADSTGSLADDEATQRAVRTLVSWQDRRGTGWFKIGLPGIDWERAMTVLDALTHPDPAGTPVPHRRSPQQRRADAFCDLISLAEASGELPASGGALPHLAVEVPYQTLSGESSEPGRGRWGTTVSPQQIRQLACDAAIIRMVTDGASQVLDVGRATRHWTVAQRRAIERRDGGCRFNTCRRPPGWCDIHHVVYWDVGGPTDRDNGVLLCRHHHTEIHHGGWTLALDPATAEVTVIKAFADGRTISHTSKPRRRPG